MIHTILIVEDSPSTRSALISTVEAVGKNKVLGAPNAYEALKLLPRHRFDLVITDINMPDINGLELVNFIRSNPQYKKVPLFIVTTEGSKRDIAKGLALGANEYIVKPFNPNSLQQLVKKYLWSD